VRPIRPTRRRPWGQVSPAKVTDFLSRGGWFPYSVDCNVQDIVCGTSRSDWAPNHTSVGKPRCFTRWARRVSLSLKRDIALQSQICGHLSSREWSGILSWSLDKRSRKLWTNATQSSTEKERSSLNARNATMNPRLRRLLITLRASTISARLFTDWNPCSTVSPWSKAVIRTRNSDKTMMEQCRNRRAIPAVDTRP